MDTFYKKVKEGREAKAYLKKVAGLYVQHIDRTNLRERIKKEWVGRDWSRTGVSYVSMDWDTGTMEVEGPGRTDIFILSLFIGSYKYNVFVDPDLSFSVARYGAPLAPFEAIEDYVETYINYYLTTKYFEFIERQRLWYEEQPWEQLEGATPKFAVTILEQLGW